MHKIFIYFIEVVSWIKIVLSPLFIGLGIGTLVYFNYPHINTLIFATVLGLAGLIIGIVWATRVWKEMGTTHFISKVDATPDLDAKK